MDQLLHAREHLLLVRQDDLAVTHVDRAAGQCGEALLEQAHALAHLLHADEVTVVTVTRLAVRHVKVEPVVHEIRVHLAKVVLHAAPAQIRASQAEIDRLLPADHADVAGAIHKNLVPCEQLVRLADGHADFLGELGQFLRPAIRQITRQPADARVGRRETRAGQRLNQVVDFFALGKRVQEHRHRADIHGKRPDAEKMRRDAGQFAADHADVLAALR